MRRSAMPRGTGAQRGAAAFAVTLHWRVAFDSAQRRRRAYAAAAARCRFDFLADYFLCLRRC